MRREQAKGRMSGPESIDETKMLSGFENSLVMNQTYTHTFQCNYQLSSYPFDTQVKVNFSSGLTLSSSIQASFSMSIVYPTSCLPFSDLLDRHGNGKPGQDHCDSDSRPTSNESGARHANLSSH